MTTLHFRLTQEDRVVEFSTTLDSDHISAHVEACRYALLSFGFSPKSISDYIGDDHADEP